MLTDAFRTVIDRLPEPLLLVSREGIVLAANRGLTGLGIEPEGIRGRPLADVAAPPSGMLSDYLRRCSKTARPLPGSLTLRKDDGGEVACRSDGSILFPSAVASEAVIMLRLEPKDTSVGKFLVLNEKIDQLGKEILRRKEAEEELREQKAWLAVTLHSIGDAVMATDAEGRVSFMNSVAESLTGWNQVEALGRPLEAVFRIINEETRATVENPVTKCLREGTIVGLANHTVLIAKDGKTEHAIDDTAAPIREADGQVKGVVLIFHDVGDRRVLERELLSRAERLAENDRKKDEFLAMLAHELRNPLAAIGNAVMITTRSGLQEHIEWSMDVISRQMQHLTRLIDDLLDVSRISRGKIELKCDVLNLTPILDSAAATTRQLIEERKHTLEVAIDGENLWANVDPTRLEQVVVNLLNNAAKYSENGGHIRLAAKSVDDEVFISVRDRGLGIPPAKLPQMFDLFTQGDRSLARSEGGLGIGLTVVKRLVELHGGSVEAKSEGPGKGSEFTIRLPKVARPVASVSRGGLPTSARRNSARILVVDDNVDTARGMERLLKLLGHELAVAHSGPSGIELARKLRPEFVLLDIGLPGMDGYEVASHLRREECGKDAVIIAVSGYGQDEDRRRSKEAGFDHHLIKPLDHDALISLISARADARD
ncbi:ATP-binding protein [Tundrisphaera lichenicola]|uniref:PAS domain-containing hybrid sensor histidine kinase/response regulator n=1 Tax=Tundrisphaera lichenicola TaxID=2029860 RepID=UPI003EB796BF